MSPHNKILGSANKYDHIICVGLSLLIETSAYTHSKPEIRLDDAIAINPPITVGYRYMNIYIKVVYITIDL